MEPDKVIKTFTSKKGNVVVFRHLKRSDLQHMLIYANTLIREDTFIGLYGKPLTATEEQEYLEEELKGVRLGNVIHVAVVINGMLAGSASVKRNRIRRKKHVGEVAIALLAKYRNEGIGIELMHTLVKEAKKMNIRLLELTCLENNPAGLHLYEKVGFQRVGIVPKAIFYKNTYINEVVMYLPL